MDLKEEKPLYQLAEIGEILRSEKGCPWDRKQTPQSLKPCIIEEAFEVADAIDQGDTENIKEELGDLLYQVYAEAQIYEELNLFNIDDVANGIREKLVRRHPHVFGEQEIKPENSEEVLKQWEQIKKQERKNNPLEKQSALDGVPVNLPALLKAKRIQGKAAHLGFDWENISDVTVKLNEEVEELKEAIAKENQENLLEKFGDVLFSMVNISRHLKISPEEALQFANNKFIKRFKFIEKETKEQKEEIKNLSATQLDELWKQAKAKGL